MRSYGSVRGAISDGRPYRVQVTVSAVKEQGGGCKIAVVPQHVQQCSALEQMALLGASLNGC